jgi:short-subunit dehydrogenase
MTTALVTGASSGIGATYADRLAKRGYDLILVARNAERLAALADRLSSTYKIKVECLPADLSSAEGWRVTVARIYKDTKLSMLINCAGIGPEGAVLQSNESELETMIQLNVMGLHQLTLAAAKVFSARGQGTIVNIASVVALLPEKFNAVYSATKAFVLALTQGLHTELAPVGVKIQAVLPGLTRTEIFERAGFDINHLDPGMIMEAGDMVDASLAGLDQGELVTIPSLPDVADWQAFLQARYALAPHLSLQHPATRYTQ